MERDGKDVLISFTTINAYPYEVMALDPATGTWHPAVTGLIGNGTILTAVDSGAGEMSVRIYRVQFTPL